MKKLTKTLPIMIIMILIVGALSVNIYAVAKKPGKPKITKTSVSLQKVTVKYKKARNAKSYRLYRVKTKTSWKYLKTIKASQKKKYKDTKKYKLKKDGKKYKVYQKKTKKTYKQLAKSKKLKMSFTGKWNTKYKLVVRAYNGKKYGKYSDAKTVKVGKRPTLDYDKYETYVFFGSDSRANDESWKSQNGGRITTDTTGTQGVPRSDVIMLLNVNREKKTINLISVYRDTALNKDVNKGNAINFQKANKAYADYGPLQACKVLEKNLDIKIKGYAAANFKGVADVIDDLGKLKIAGLNMKTDQANKEYGDDVTDVANRYINEMNTKYGRETTLIAKGADEQELVGLQAVGYSRVRYTEGSDRKRSERQRLVLKKMIEKFNTLTESKKFSIFENNVSGIETNMGVSNLAKLVMDVSIYTINESEFPYSYKAVIKETSEEKGDVSTLLVPDDLSENVTKLHQYIYEEDWYEPSKTVKKYNKEITREFNLGR